MERGLNRSALLLFALSFLLLSVSPYLLSYGMFLDGVVYSAVSRNLAIGFGTLWKPAYSLTLGREFYGHPPLSFWLQSLFYRLLGDNLWVDKLYSFSVAALNLTLFSVLYRRLRREEDPGPWAPLLVLFSFHSYRWVIRNNMLENATSTFVLLSLLFYVSALRKGSLYSLPAGLSVLLAFLVKGPVGLFPLATPLFLPSKAKTRRRILITTIGVGVFLLAFLLLLLNGEVRHFFSEYLRRQLEASLTGRENPAPTRFYILYALLTELLFPLSFLLPLLLVFRRLRWDRSTLGYLLVALAGSLPIMVSIKQARFYLHPSLFFYALFLSSLFSPVLKAVEEWGPTWKVALPVSLINLVVASVVAYVNMGTGTGGYAPFYRTFVERPANLRLKRHEYLSVCPKGLYANWSMFAGMERVFKLSMSQRVGYRYLLVDREACHGVPKGYVLLHPDPPDGFRFLLYVKERP